MLLEQTAPATKPQGTIQDVINFIFERKEGTGLATWTKGQIGCWVMQRIQDYTIRVAFESPETFKVIGVVVIEPKFPHGFLVDQIWCANKKAMRMFLHQLQAEFPEVTQIWGWRVNCLVPFKLKTLFKIYGR